MSRRLTVICLVLVTILGFAALGVASAQTKIGLILPQADADGFRANYIGALAAAEELGAEIVMLSAQNAAELQLSQIEDLITQKVAAIIFIPVDSGALSMGVERANQANVPIVAMDRSTTGGHLTGLVESDNVAHGAAAADLMAEAATKAGIPLNEVVILELLGDLATSAGAERHEGFSTRAEELGMTIVAQLPTRWNNDEAFAAVLDGFQANPKINAIFEASDIAMHAGVESALSSLGKLAPIGSAGHIIITAVDGGPYGLKSVRSGYIDGIAAQELLGMGRQAVKIAIDAINSPDQDPVIIRLAPGLVVPENVDSLEHWANTIEL